MSLVYMTVVYSIVWVVHNLSNKFLVERFTNTSNVSVNRLVYETFHTQTVYLEENS